MVAFGVWLSYFWYATLDSRSLHHSGYFRGSRQRWIIFGRRLLFPQTQHSHSVLALGCGGTSTFPLKVSFATFCGPTLFPTILEDQGNIDAQLEDDLVLHLTSSASSNGSIFWYFQTVYSKIVHKSGIHPEVSEYFLTIPLRARSNDDLHSDDDLELKLAPFSPATQFLTLFPLRCERIRRCLSPHNHDLTTFESALYAKIAYSTAPSYENFTFLHCTALEVYFLNSNLICLTLTRLDDFTAATRHDAPAKVSPTSPSSLFHLRVITLPGSAFAPSCTAQTYTHTIPQQSYRTEQHSTRQRQRFPS